MSADPPVMRAWNLTLRFLLELAALAGLALLGWNAVDGVVRWLLVILLPVIGAAAWGTFNVAGDPSRSGKAPVAVAGWLRLALEVLIFGVGAWGLIQWSPAVGYVVIVLAVIHYLVGWQRVRWLLGGRARPN